LQKKETLIALCADTFSNHSGYDKKRKDPMITLMREKTIPLTVPNSKWLNHLLALMIGVVAAMTIVQFQLTRIAELDGKKNQTYPKATYLAEEQVTQSNLDLLFKLPKLGFENLIANGSFLSFIQYFGDDVARQSTGYSVTPSFFKVIVSRDPLFLGMYPYLSSSVSLFAGQPQQTVSLLEQGLRSIPPQLQPDAYFLWQSKGTDELLFLGRNSAAQASYEKAAEWASRSSDPQIQSIAKRSRQTAQFLAANPDSRQARVASWFNILTNAIDDSTRQFAVQQITALGGKVSVTEQGALQVKMPKQD
jgi:hypothetical protein